MAERKTGDDRSSLQALDYSQVKARHVEDSVVTKLYAVPFDSALPVAKRSRSRYKPYLYCLCVQDSPDNPCLCDRFIIWLPLDRIFSDEPSGRKDKDGRLVSEIHIARDAQILIDTQIPV